MKSLAVALIFFYVSWKAGARFLQLIRVRAGSGVEGAIFETGAGVWILTLYVLALGATGFLYPIILWSPLIIIAALHAILDLRSYFIRRRSNEKSRAGQTVETTPTPLWIYAAWSLLALAVFVNVARCFVPVTAFDSLTYHLAVPKIYLSLHSIYNLPTISYAGFPLTAQLTYLYALAAGAPSGASFIHAGFALLTAAMLYTWSSRAFSPSVAIIATLIYYASPMIGLESVSPLVDMVAVFYGSIAIACLVPGSPPGRDADHHALCALFIGVAISAKWSCAPVAILIGAWAIVRCISALRQNAPGARFAFFLRFLPRAIGLLLLAGLPSLPYFIKNLLFIGNPVWPVFSGVLGGGEFSIEAIERLTTFIYNQLAVERTIPNLLALPWNMTMNEWRYAGAIAPTFLCFIPLYSIVRKNADVSFLISFSVLFFPVFFFTLDPQLRYLMPIIPALSLASAWIIVELRGRLLRPVVVCAVSAGLIFCVASSLIGESGFLSDLPVLTGRESRRDYLVRNAPEYELYEWVNKNARPDDKVLLGEVLNRGYYLDVPYLWGHPILQGLFRYEEMSGPAELDRILRREGISLIIFRYPEKDLRDPGASGEGRFPLLSPRAKNTWIDFIAQYTKTVYSKDSGTILRLND